MPLAVTTLPVEERVPPMLIPATVEEYARERGISLTEDEVNEISCLCGSGLLADIDSLVATACQRKLSALFTQSGIERQA